MLVYIRGAGDIASGIAIRLHHAGFQIVMSDIPRPTSIRRTVCFSEAIRFGTARVEDTMARFAETTEQVREILVGGDIAVLADPEARLVPELKPDALVDAILAKRNLGTKLTDAPVVVGVGPGFTAGEDCTCCVETMRGHTLGRVITEGSPLPNTNIPGLIGGFSGERILRAPADGIFRQLREIGDHVKEGEAVGTVEGVPMCCNISGVLRGLIAEGTPVNKGMKSGDVDPRDDDGYCRLVSDKALAVGGGVLEAILRFRPGTV